MLVDKKRASGRWCGRLKLTSYGQVMAQCEQTGRDPPPAPQQSQMLASGGGAGELEEGCTLRKGLLWYCRDTLLSRWNWKQRYFILTQDYLSCFKKAKSEYSDMGTFLFKLPLASLSGVEWQRLRGQAAVAVSDPGEGRILIRANHDTLDQWYKVLKSASESSRERRRYLRLSSTNLSTLALSDSSPAIDRLCERVERQVWGGCTPGSSSGSGRLMRRQKSEMDTGLVLRRQLHYASQKRLNRHSMMPEMELFSSPQHRPDTNDVIRHGCGTGDVIGRGCVLRRHNDSLDSAGHSPSTTPSKSSVSSSEGSAVHIRAGGARLGRTSVAECATRTGSSATEGSTGLRLGSSVRRQNRGYLAGGLTSEHGRPRSMVYDLPTPIEYVHTEVVMRKKDRTSRLRGEHLAELRAESRRSCDLSLLHGHPAVQPPRAGPRKDHTLGHVILSEKRAHQPSQLPHYVRSVAAFEAMVRAPVGRTWIPSAAHQKLTMPAVATKAGTVIPPMDEGALLRLGGRRRPV